LEITNATSCPEKKQRYLVKKSEDHNTARLLSTQMIIVQKKQTKSKEATKQANRNVAEKTVLFQDDEES